MIYFQNRHSGELLYSLGYSLGPGIRDTAFALAFLGMTLLVASNFRPSPVSIGGTPEASGLSRITRHPLMLSIGLIGTAHLMMHGYASDVAFFGGLVFFSVIGSLHQDHRQRLTRPELKEMFQVTSWLPFGAIVKRRNRLILSELPWLGFLIGAVVAYFVWRLHVRLLAG